MRLISLKTKNFRVFRELHLDFSDRVIGIIGPNGAGKSSIIEAISYALYGNQVSRTGKDGIKSTFAGPNEDCEVTLEFAVNDEKYRVVRRLVGKQSRAEVELYRGDASDSIGVSETRQYVGQLLGLDWRGFLTSFLARQQELNALSDLQPSKRKDHLAGMLGIERLDTAIKRAKADSSRLESEAAFIERQLGESEAVRARIEELTAGMAKIVETSDRARSLMEGARKGLAAIDELYQKMMTAQSSYLQLSGQLKGTEATLQNLLDQQRQNSAETESLNRQEAEAIPLREKVRSLNEVRGRLELLVEARNRAGVASELTSQMKEVSTQIDLFSKRLETSHTKLESIDTELARIPKDVGRKRDSTAERLSQAREQYTEIAAQKSGIVVELDKLSKQTDSIAELGPDSVCDRCLRPLGDDLDQIHSHLNQDRDRLTGQLDEVEQKLGLVRKEGESLKAELELLETQSRKLFEQTSQREGLLRELESLRQQVADLTSRRGKMKDRLKDLGDCSFDQKLFDNLTKEMDNLEKDRARLDKLSGVLTRRTELQAISVATDKKIVGLNLEIEALKVEISKSLFNGVEFAATGEKLRKARDEYESARDQFQRADQLRAQAEVELTEKQERLDGFKKMSDELETSRESRYYAEKLGGLMGEYKLHLISRIRPTLAEISSRLFAEMTDNRYGLIELDEKYNLRLLDYGQYFDVERFSGGEKDLANLCLRLSISLALTESAGLERSFIILDEVFGSQDNNRKELIVSALSRLKTRFPQILLVTHIEEIKDRVEELIEVIPSGAGWSEVRINGA